MPRPRVPARLNGSWLAIAWIPPSASRKIATAWPRTSAVTPRSTGRSARAHTGIQTPSSCCAVIATRAALPSRPSSPGPRTYEAQVFAAFGECYEQENACAPLSGRLCLVTLPRTGVVLLAAGSGNRVGADTNKVLLPLAGLPVLGWSLRTVTAMPYVERLVVVHRQQGRAGVEGLVLDRLPEGREAVLVTGGETRHGSEWRALAALRTAVQAGELDVVALHDAARPLADPALFEATVRAAHEHGGGIPVRPQTGLLHRDGGPRVRGLVAVQTPQAFRAGPLLEAYARAEADGFTGTDTASCVARYTDLPIHAGPAPATNLKITYPEDVALAERLLAALPPPTDTRADTPG